MSREEAIVLASRTLAVLMMVWALGEVCALPQALILYTRYLHLGPFPTESAQHWRQYYTVEIGFLITKILGFALLARWLFRGGPEVAALMMPTTQSEIAVQQDPQA